MMGFGFGGFGMVLMILFWILLIAAAIWFVARLFPQIAGQPPSGTSSTKDLTAPTPGDILKERYARGEISKEQYEEMRRTLAA